MHKAIVTRYHGPGAVRGSKISARAVDNQAVFYEYDHASAHDERHAAVAKLYAERKNWPGLYVTGYVAGADYVYVNIGKKVSPSMIAGHSLPLHPLGFEGVDWFYVSPREGE